MTRDIVENSMDLEERTDCVWKILAEMDINRNYEEALKDCYDCDPDGSILRTCYTDINRFMGYFKGVK